jgi:hypothetical protein
MRSRALAVVAEESINVPMQPDPRPVPGPKGWNVKIPGAHVT